MTDEPLPTLREILKCPQCRQHLDRHISTLNDTYTKLTDAQMAAVKKELVRVHKADHEIPSRS